MINGYILQSYVPETLVINVASCVCYIIPVTFFCSAGNPYPYQPTQYVPPRYIRNPPPPGESAVAPYQDTYPGYGPERQYPGPHSGPPFSTVSPHPYPPPSHYDGRRHGPYPGPPPPPQSFAPPRDDLVRMSPVPLDVPPAPLPPATAGVAGSLYHPDSSSRDRYPPDGYYPPAPHPGQMRSHVRVSDRDSCYLYN